MSRIPPGHIGEVLQAHSVGGGPRSDAAGLGMSQCPPPEELKEVLRRRWSKISD